MNAWEFQAVSPVRISNERYEVWGIAHVIYLDLLDKGISVGLGGCYITSVARQDCAATADIYETEF